MMTGTYTFRALASKYGNFCVPLVKIKRDGSDLVSELKLSIVNIRAALSIHAASMVLFKIGGLYDEASHSFDKKVKSYFTLGSIMEVEIGYLSYTCKIFKGFVAMLGAEFDQTPFLVVTLMDVRRLMMLSGSRYMLHEVVNYSDAFKTIMNKYSKLCSAEIDATDDSLEKPLSQTQNDYLFVTRELIKNGKADREFFVLGNKAYFRQPRKVKQPVMTLQYGRELLALKVDEEYQDLKVEVIGYDEQAQDAVRGSAAVKSNKNKKKLFSSTQIYTVADPSVNTKKKASAKAKMIAREKGQKARSGRGVTIGLPELVPGRFVKVEALEKDYGDHTYYIESVVHEINGEKFQTTFEIGGWD